jgi:hypothetical protein
VAAAAAGLAAGASAEFAADPSAPFPAPAASPAPEFRPVLQGEAEDYFVTPLRGRPHLRPIRITDDLFYDRFRIGVDSGLLYPLAARAADFNAGWWARVYGQTGADLGHPLFRTSVEVGLGLGQSQSSHDDQQFRITSNYTFLSVRGVADFLPESPTDLLLYAGLGAGLEFASGHVIQSTGMIEERRRTNFNPLFEFGAGIGFELMPGFCLEGRVTATHPLGSANIMLFLQAELGVEFLFL